MIYSYSKGSLSEVIKWATANTPKGMSWNISGSQIINTVERFLREGQMSYRNYCGYHD